MLMSISCLSEDTKVQQDSQPEIEHNQCSDVKKPDTPADKLDSSRLSGLSIMALLNEIMFYLQKYADWMMDENLKTAALLGSNAMKGALDALHKTQASAKKELSARQNNLYGQIGASFLGIAAPCVGAVIGLKYFVDKGAEAILGASLVVNGIGSGGSGLANAITEKCNAGTLTQAQIEKAQADNQRQLLSVLETVRAWRDNVANQMANQIQQINTHRIDISRSFAKFFDTPMI